MFEKIRNWLRMRLPVTKRGFLCEMKAELDCREARINAKLDALLAAVADGNARGVSLAERGAAAAERGAAAAERGAAAAERGAAAAEHVVAEIPPNAKALDRVHSRVTHLVRRVEERFAKEERTEALGENIKRMLTLPEDGALPVVFITDSGYVRPTCVAISSLIRHRDVKTRYDIHVIGVDLTEEDRRSLEVFGEAVHVICPANKYASFQAEHPHVSKAALFKFDLADLLPNHEKVLYLDSDVLVLQDLHALSELDLSSVYVAAVRDYAGMSSGRHHERLGLDSYFNSGVMLLNLKRMRQDKMHDALLKAKDETDLKYPGMFMDQDAFNLAFGGAVYWLNPGYNLMYTNNLQVGDRDAAAAFYGLSLKAYLRTESNPMIVHLTNYVKPWDSIAADLYELYIHEAVLFDGFANLECGDGPLCRGSV